MAKGYSKQQIEFMNAAGLLLDTDAGCYFGRRGEYSMLLRIINNQYVVSVSAAKNGAAPNPAELQTAVQECQAIQSCNVQGYRANFYLNGGITAKKVLEKITQACNYIPNFLQQSGYRNVCEHLGCPAHQGKEHEAKICRAQGSGVRCWALLVTHMWSGKSRDLPGVSH